MAGNFTPPPTYASVVLYDENAPDVKQLLRSVRFNPIWLKWFVDVAQFITQAGGGGGGGPVTSVTATSPVTSTGGTTPIIAITGSALTRVNDTNVTLVLGGTPASALLAAASITVGWTGTLAESRGGTGLSALGTGVATALAVNVGTAGAVVVNGGALGTPASGVATNLTGTAAGLSIGGNAATASAVALGGITGLGANVATALAVAVGSAGAFVTFNGAGGTPSSMTATNLSGTAASLTAGQATILANTRTLWGNNFNGSANVTGTIIASTNGIELPNIAGTGTGYSSNYTPTLTNGTNVTGSTAYPCQYFRVGNKVMVSGHFDVDPTAAGAMDLQISLPVASNFTTADQCGGTAAGRSATEAFTISPDIANNTANVEGAAVTTTDHTIYFTFMYDVV